LLPRYDRRARRPNEHVLELTRDPQQHPIRPPKPGLHGIFPATAGTIHIERRKLFEQVPIIARRARHVQRGIREAGEQAGDRPAGRVPAAEHARHVPIRDLPLERARPAFVLPSRVPAVNGGPVQGVYVAPDWYGIIGCGHLRRELILREAEVIRWEEVPRVVVLRSGYRGIRDIGGYIGQCLESKEDMRWPRVREIFGENEFIFSSWFTKKVRAKSVTYPTVAQS